MIVQQFHHGMMTCSLNDEELSEAFIATNGTKQVGVLASRCSSMMFATMLKDDGTFTK
uniref:Uncharacterized protein n=1 Tax=Arion vulgaris TaxID=1028688 RepID=A0A0B7APR1_9EUPU